MYRGKTQGDLEVNTGNTGNSGAQTQSEKKSLKLTEHTILRPIVTAAAATERTWKKRSLNGYSACSRMLVTIDNTNYSKPLSNQLSH